MIHTLENSQVSLSFDDQHCCITSLMNKASGDEYIKKDVSCPVVSLSMLLQGTSEQVTFTPAEPAQRLLSKDNCLDFEIRSVQGGARRLPVVLHLSVMITTDSGELSWRLEIENGCQDWEVIEIVFPTIRGLALGPRWQDNILIYPHHAGEKTVNPVETYTSQRYLSFFRSQTHPENGLWWREINYCGLASMSWMYLYDSANGFYLGSHDPTFPVTGLRVETGGPGDPWMGFTFRKYERICPGETWQSMPVLMAATIEGWHWGARRYREWIWPLLDCKTNPDFLDEEATLNQCYNFKKEGKIAHRFEDIPQLFERGQQAFSARHMFIASWNRSGFDTDYPEYHPDMELGTPLDLWNACQQVNNEGGFVTFYINARIFNLDSDFHATLGQRWGVKTPSGNLVHEQYGPQKFSVNCPAHTEWQKHILDTAEWMVRSYQARGIYLDQLGSAEPFPCYDAQHTHSGSGEFNQGYLTMLRELLPRLREIDPLSFLMIENCGDLYSPYVWGNLTWNGDPYDEYYNIYKFTFPEFVQVNMVNPRQALPFDEREDRFKRDLERAMLLGSIFWLGLEKFEGENLPLVDIMRQAVDLRVRLTPILRQAVFADLEGVTSVDDGVTATHWLLDEGAHLLILANPSGQPGRWVELQLPPDGVYRLETENNDGQSEIVNTELVQSGLRVGVPAHWLSFIAIRPEKGGEDALDGSR